jgi:hypothetical protein
MKEILEYLADFGEGSDLEIAIATELPLADVRLHLSELVAQQAILACRSIRFEQGEEVEELICRMIGYSRPIKRSSKPKAQMKAALADNHLAHS